MHASWESGREEAVSEHKLPLDNAVAVLGPELLVQGPVSVRTIKFESGFPVPHPSTTRRYLKH